MLCVSTEFEWDPRKNESNLRKHGINFETAELVFNDPNRVETQDRFDGGEERWQSIGLVGGYHLVLVAHTIREEGEDEVIRIISARRATKSEQKRYERQ